MNPEISLTELMKKDAERLSRLSQGGLSHDVRAALRYSWFVGLSGASFPFTESPEVPPTEPEYYI